MTTGPAGETSDLTPALRRDLWRVWRSCPEADRAERIFARIADERAPAWMLAGTLLTAAAGVAGIVGGLTLLGPTGTLDRPPTFNALRAGGVTLVATALAIWRSPVRFRTARLIAAPGVRLLAASFGAISTVAFAAGTTLASTGSALVGAGAGLAAVGLLVASWFADSDPRSLWERRERYPWWPRLDDPPRVLELLAAQGEPIREQLEAARDEVRSLAPDRLVTEVGSGAWTRRLTAAAELLRRDLTLEAGVLFGLVAIARDPRARGRVIAAHLVDRLVRRHPPQGDEPATSRLCPSCLARHVRLDLGAGRVVVACRRCGRTREPRVHPGPVVLLLDEGGGAPESPPADPAAPLRVRWGHVPATVDFDEVRIGAASDRAIESMVIAVANDDDEIRRGMLPRIPVRFDEGASPSPQARALLDRTFGDLQATGGPGASALPWPERRPPGRSRHLATEGAPGALVGGEGEAPRPGLLPVDLHRGWVVGVETFAAIGAPLLFLTTALTHGRPWLEALPSSRAWPLLGAGALGLSALSVVLGRRLLIHPVSARCPRCQGRAHPAERRDFLERDSTYRCSACGHLAA